MKAKFINKCLDPECETIDIHFGEEVLQVKKYISLEIFRDILTEAFMRATDIDTGIMSEINFKKMIQILLINEYTDIGFTEEDKYELSEQTYNIIMSNDIFYTIIYNHDDKIHMKYDYDLAMKEFNYMRKYQLSARCVLNEFKNAGDEIGQKLKSYLEDQENAEDLINTMQNLLDRSEE